MARRASTARRSVWNNLQKIESCDSSKTGRFLQPLAFREQLDTDDLGAAFQAPQRFDLGCVGPQQPGRRGRHRSNTSIATGGSPEPAKHPMAALCVQAIWMTRA